MRCRLPGASVALALSLLACTRHIDLPELVTDAAAPLDAPIAEPDGPEQWVGEPMDGPRADVRPGDASRTDAGQVSNVNACRSNCVYFGRSSAEQAQVTIALDRSFSMFEPGAGGTPSRNEVVYQALSALLRQYRPALDFSYIEFPGAPGSSGSCQFNTCCAGFLLPDNNDIERRVRCETNAGGCFARSNDTPAAEALRRCAEHFESDDRYDRRQRHVVMLVDGEPSCANERPEVSCQSALAAVARLSREGVRTSVIAVTETLRGNACLEALAQSGVAGGSLTVATDAIQVRTALQELFERLSIDACRYSLAGTAINPDRVQVYIDARYCLPRDPYRRSGWDFDGSPQYVRIYGQACEAVRRGAVQVYAVQCR